MRRRPIDSVPPNEVKVLRNWAVTSPPCDKFKAPELRVKYLHGALPCGKIISTNYIVDRVGPATYKTRSGSLYKLEGDAHPDYAAWCKKNGFAMDPTDPIRFVPDDHREPRVI